MLANNLANATTSGFKTDREFYGLYSSEDAENSLGSTSTAPVIERTWTDFSQGTLQPTGNPLDLALSGRGFFAVKGPDGALYTRNGSFQVSRDGELITGDGYPVRTAGGASMVMAPGHPVEVTLAGTVRQQGRTIGQLEIVDFKSTDSLQKVSGSNFRNTDLKNPPIPAANVDVQQGKIEASNVVVSESAMRLVGVMRQFEMLQKAVQMGVEMNSKAIQEVARVSS